jgi:uncharacterized radical SAM superfamily Fe-S cluster-containing enzyme
MANVRPYMFYDTTSSICSTCLYTVEAKIIIKNNHVYMDKWCPTHGIERVLIMDDAEYYRQCREVYIKQPEMPHHFATKMEYGCPYDCGLCPDHMQHACLSIVEITDHCNLACPVCYADSGPTRQTHRSITEVTKMFDAIIKSEVEADIVQLSGGEPTTHPQFFEIMDLARTYPIKHLMINTNGLRIANDPEFAERLASYAPALEIYLQFDSMRDDRLQVLRGANLVKTRQAALAVLDRYNISTTLVVTLKKGLNDDEIGDIIQEGLRHPSVRGVTFQPIQDAGRVEDYDPLLHRLTVSEIRRKIAEQSNLFTLADIVPVPCNPDTLAMGYALRDAQQGAIPLTRYIDPQVLVDGSRNTIVFERDEGFKQKAKEQLFKVMSTNHSPESQANCLSELLCCLPNIDAPDIGYNQVFRVMIVQFMDAYSLDIRSLKKSCIHFATVEGKLIPFESYNLFYRDDNKKKLAEIRSVLKKGFEMRKSNRII